MKPRLFFIIFLLSILCGCGYTTHSILPTGESSLHVDNFISKIDVTKEAQDTAVYGAYIPRMEADVTREIIDRFILDGNFKIKEKDKAHFLLKGELVDFKREPLRYDANDVVTEFRVRVVVDLEFYDLEQEKVVWCEKNFGGENTYRTTGEFAKSEDVAVKEAMKDLARRIVERTVENW